MGDETKRGDGTNLYLAYARLPKQPRANSTRPQPTESDIADQLLAELETNYESPDPVECTVSPTATSEPPGTVGANVPYQRVAAATPHVAASPTLEPRYGASVIEQMERELHSPPSSKPMLSKLKSYLSSICCSLSKRQAMSDMSASAALCSTDYSQTSYKDHRNNSSSATKCAFVCGMIFVVTCVVIVCVYTSESTEIPLPKSSINDIQSHPESPHVCPKCPMVVEIVKQPPTLVFVRSNWTEPRSLSPYSFNGYTGSYPIRSEPYSKDMWDMLVPYAIGKLLETELAIRHRDEMCLGAEEVGYFFPHIVVRDDTDGLPPIHMIEPSFKPMSSHGGRPLSPMFGTYTEPVYRSCRADDRVVVETRTKQRYLYILVTYYTLQHSYPLVYTKTLSGERALCVQYYLDQIAQSDRECGRPVDSDVR